MIDYDSWIERERERLAGMTLPEQLKYAFEEGAYRGFADGITKGKTDGIGIAGEGAREIYGSGFSDGFSQGFKSVRMPMPMSQPEEASPEVGELEE